MPIKNDISALDNRMTWIRNLEQIDSGNCHWMEYEIASEGYINGLFNWASKSEEGVILCSCLDMVADHSGLYHYLIRIKTAEWRGPDRAAKDGYVCPEGIIGELLSLFSLFYRRRFYLIASYYGELTDHSMKIRTIMPFIRVFYSPSLHREVFSKKHSDWEEIHRFLKSVISLDVRYHPQFILAAYHYAKALSEIGINSEMVIVKLVSSVEALSCSIALDDEKKDPLAGINIDTLSLSREQKEEFCEILDGRKALAKFRVFVEENSRESFEGPQEGSLTKVGLKDLNKRLNAIYSARSAYLHKGEPMYLSSGSPLGDWDMDPSLGMQMDRRLYKEKQKLPYISWFDGIVRNCLLNFLENHQRLT